MTTRSTIALLAVTFLALATIACGGAADATDTADATDATVAAGDSADAAPAAGAASGPTVGSDQAGEHDLAPTDAYWVEASDSYYDIYLTDHPMTSSSFAYGSTVPDGQVLVVAAVENQDGAPIAAGQTFTFNSSANGRLTAMLRSPAGRETFTVVDDVSLGNLEITEISGATLRGEIDVVKDDKVIRGPFTATRLPS